MFVVLYASFLLLGEAETGLARAAACFCFVDLDGTLLSSVTWLHVQVVCCLQTTLPCCGIDIDVIVDVACLKVHITADCLVDPLLCPGRHFDEGIWAELEACFVHVLDVLWNCINLLYITLLAQYVFFDLIPKSEFLKVVD